MKPSCLLLASVFSLWTSAASYAQEEKPEGPLPSYFDQKEPGLVPQRFAPGVVSVQGRDEYGVIFSPDLKELYFTPTVDGIPRVHVARWADGHWTKPVAANFTRGKVQQEVGTGLSDTGHILFFATQSDDYPFKIWSARRTDDSWAEPELVDSAINSHKVSLASFAWNYDLFFNNLEDGRLYIAPRINRRYPKVRPVAIPYGTHGFISPDMDYLLVEAHKNNDASKDKDILVYFKREDGRWSEPMALGETVNTAFQEGQPTLSPDGKYLFFSRYDQPDGSPDIYWVSADLIAEAKQRWLASLPAETGQKAPEIASYDKDALSFGFEHSLPNLRNAWLDATPPDNGDGLKVGKLASIGENKAAVLAFAQDLADDKLGDFDSLLIAHNSKLVFESYYKKGRGNLPHFQASTTKGHTTLTLARAMQMGYLSMADLHKPAVELITGLDKEQWAQGAELITLDKAMTMRSGVRVDEAQQDDIFSQSRDNKDFDFIQAFLTQSDAITAESQTYLYQGFDPRLTMRVVDSVVPDGAGTFLHNEVLGKLGITDYGWKKDARGIPNAGSGSSLTSRDMLKLGLVVLNKGKWHGEQLFSAELIEQATRGITKPISDWMADYYRYGYFWYQAQLSTEKHNFDVTLAWGAGGNRLIVVEELQLVIALTGHDRGDDILPKMAERILPAFVSQ